jgi:hypothetical protein
MIVAVAVNPENANELLVVYGAGELMLWDLKARKMLRRLSLTERAVRSTQPSPTSRPGPSSPILSMECPIDRDKNGAVALAPLYLSVHMMCADAVDGDVGRRAACVFGGMAPDRPLFCGRV